jgi:large subunit ribosomal protein L13
MKTVSINKETANREWLVVDLEGQTVGRAAARIAAVLRGKHKPSYTPHADAGDFVVAVNCEKVVFTGNKLQDKLYYRHSHHPGGLTEMTAGQMLDRHPERVMMLAVKGIYTGAEHPHAAQQPKVLELA